MPKKRSFSHKTNKQSLHKLEGARKAKIKTNHPPLTRTSSTRTDISNNIPTAINFNKLPLFNHQSTRLLIGKLYDILGRPPPEKWFGRKGTVTTIARTLKLVRGSRSVIFNVLYDVIDCLKKGVEHTGKDKFQKEYIGRRILKTGSIEEQLIADWMEDGLGFCLTTMLINVH